MKKLLSVFLCVMMVLLMSVTPAAFAQEEELSKDVTINVYSWWDPTKVGMVNLKEGFEKKYAHQAGRHQAGGRQQRGHRCDDDRLRQDPAVRRE